MERTDVIPLARVVVFAQEASGGIAVANRLYQDPGHGRLLDLGRCDVIRSMKRHQISKPTVPLVVVGDVSPSELEQSTRRRGKINMWLVENPSERTDVRDS
jgi:hypothetical protein